MKVFGVLGDMQGCGWYRMLTPFTALAQQHPDWMFYLDGLMPDSVADVDVLVAQRTHLPGPSATFQRHCREGRTRTVLELDDDLWHLEPSNRRATEVYTADRLANLRRNVEMADVVTTTTDTLAERLATINPNVVVLPNMVPKWLLAHDRPVTNSRVTLGWAGSMSHVRDWGEVNAPLRRLLQTPAYRDRVELHMIGPDWTDRVRTPRSTVRHTGWFDSVVDLYEAYDFDIGLAPLRPSPFNDAKSDVKLLEYAALGIPCVASNTGPYLAREGGRHLTCDDAAQWGERLAELVNEPEYRTAVGKSAREWAASRTIERNAHLWESAYSMK